MNNTKSLTIDNEGLLFIAQNSCGTFAGYPIAFYCTLSLFIQISPNGEMLNLAKKQPIAAIDFNTDLIQNPVVATSRRFDSDPQYHFK